ncbi:hypothetical protein A2U01_0079420, partial [Trifolium medium]|nr:hypothetical protein [Trifolium medium]
QEEMSSKENAQMSVMSVPEM